MSICCTTSLSMIPPVCSLTRPSVALSVHDIASQSIIPICPSYDQSIRHPINALLTCPSVTSPISPMISLSHHLSTSDHLYPILPHLSGCPSPSDHSSTIFTSPSDCLSLLGHLYNKPTSLSACLSPSDSLTATMTHPTICPSSSTMIQHTQDSSQSLAVMNGEQLHKGR